MQKREKNNMKLCLSLQSYSRSKAVISSHHTFQSNIPVDTGIFTEGTNRKTEIGTPWFIPPLKANR